MKNVGEFLYAIMGGFFVSLGGVAYLMTDSLAFGALLFSTGLFAVYTLKYNLFTGKAGYILENDPRTYSILLVIVYFGNMLGTFIVSSMMKLTKHGPMLMEKAYAVSQGKINDSLLSIFILAIFCNVFIVFAVEQYNDNPHEIGKYLGMIYGVVIFIVAGFEHCIANMFYFFMGNAWSGIAVKALIVATVGNIVGGVIVPGSKTLKQKIDGLE